MGLVPAASNQENRKHMIQERAAQITGSELPRLVQMMVAKVEPLW